MQSSEGKRAELGFELGMQGGEREKRGGEERVSQYVRPPIGEGSAIY